MSQQQQQQTYLGNRKRSNSGVPKANHHDIRQIKLLLEIGSHFLAENEIIKKRKLRAQVVNQIRDIVSYKYDGMIRADANSPTASLEDHKSQLELITNLLAEAHSMSQLKPEFVKWMICRLLRSRTFSKVETVLGGQLQRCIIHIARFLDSNQMLLFARHSINQLIHLIIEDGYSFCVMPADESIMELYRDTSVSLPHCTTARETVINSLLDIFRHCQVDFGKLSEEEMARLWLILTRLCVSDCTPIQASAILLGRSLLSCNQSFSVALRSFVDKILTLQEAKPVKADLQLPINGALQIFMEMFMFWPKFTVVRSIPIRTMVVWMQRLFALYDSPQKVYPLNFLISLMRVVVMRDREQLKEEFLAEFNGLRDSCKVLIESLLKEGNEAKVKHMSVSCAFILGCDDGEAYLRSLCSEYSSALSQCGERPDFLPTIRQLAAALSQMPPHYNPFGSALLSALMPNSEVIIQALNSCKSNNQLASNVLLSLFSLIGDTLKASVADPSLAVAFLSLPWFTDPQAIILAKTHLASNLLVKDMIKYAKEFNEILTDSVRASTVSALSQMSDFAGWRQELLLLGLSSSRPPLLDSLLENIPLFVSHHPTKCSIVQQGLLDLIEKLRKTDGEAFNRQLASILRAQSRCLCASSQRGDFRPSTFDCSECRSLVSQLHPSSSPQHVPNALFDFVKELLSGERVYLNERLNKWELVILIFSLLCHVGHQERQMREILETSLLFIRDEDQEIRHEYCEIFRLIISLSVISTTTLKELINDQLSFESDCDNASISLALVPFFSVCCRHSTDVSFVLWTLRDFFIRSIRLLLNHENSSAFESLSEVVAELTEKSALSTTEQGYLFTKHCRALCEDFLGEMVEAVGKEKEQSAAGDTVQKGISQDNVDRILFSVVRATAEAFDFESPKKFVNVLRRHIVPTVLVSANNSLPFDIAVAILDFLTIADEYDETEQEETVPTARRRNSMSQTHICEQRATLITQNFFNVFERRLTKQRKKNIHDFMQAYCSLDFPELLTSKRYECTQVVLRNVRISPTELQAAESEMRVACELLKYINQHNIKRDFSLTTLFNYDCEYLGYLLSFRRCILETEHFEMLPAIFASLASIIENLDPDFVDRLSNKLILVLRAATQQGIGSLTPWIALVRKLQAKALATSLPQILIAIEPLLQFDESEQLLDVIFLERYPQLSDHSESFKRTAQVMLRKDGGQKTRIAKYLDQSLAFDSNETVIRGCISLLTEECDTVGTVALERLLGLLDGKPLEDELASTMVNALLHTLRGSNKKTVKLLAAKCLGRMGAIDPGRVTLPLKSQSSTVFVDEEMFEVEILEECWRVYSNLLDAELIDMVEYSLQTLLAIIVGKNDNKKILKRLNSDCRRDIEPLRNANLSEVKDCENNVNNLPLAENVSDFSEWLLTLFLYGSAHVRSSPQMDIFSALKFIVKTRDCEFIRHILPQLIIQLILENFDTKDYEAEMEAVLRKCVSTNARGWTHQAAHVVFSILDTFERYVEKRKAKKKTNDKELMQTQSMLARITSFTVENGELLIVVAAEKCNCLTRALRWCEQYAIKTEENETTTFNRTHFYALERIYTQLQNVDGVQGAFECIAHNEEPTADERILALEAGGHYTDALPLYSQSIFQNQSSLIKCLLRLNEPLLALSTAGSFLAEETTQHKDSNAINELHAHQLEAVWKLRNWKKLGPMLQTNDPLMNEKDTTWGASCASLLYTINQNDIEAVRIRLDMARNKIAEKLAGITIEESDIYTQAYKHVAQLHVLEEIEMTTEVAEEDSPARERALVAKWKPRSDCVVQCANVLEPILRVRRDLLLANRSREQEESDEVKRSICQLLLHSSRLARQDSHMQVAWSFLVEAKTLNVNHKDVIMEHARFEFQKGNQSSAISLLSKLLQDHLPAMHTLFEQMAGSSGSRGSRERQDKQSVDRAINSTSIEARIAFAEVQLLRAEYMQKAGAVGSSDLYQIYNTLQKMDVPSEDLHHRVALFCDNMYTMTSQNEQLKIRTELVPNILKSYSNALKFGRTHLSHAMPRMLTIWLDVSEAKTSRIATLKRNASQKEQLEKEEADIKNMNQQILHSLKELDAYCFYFSFAQLISRIGHPNDSVFQTLMMIISDLLTKYPHQCIWQSIAVYRSTGSNGRQEQCARIYQTAIRKNPKLAEIIDQYDYISGWFIKIANKGLRSGSFTDLSRHFPQLFEFFKTGKIDPQDLVNRRGLSRLTKVTPCVMIPLTEVMEHSLPKNHKVRVASFSQFVVDPSAAELCPFESLGEVYIHSICNEYMVMKSLVKPKRIGLRSSDGRTVLVMCKPQDELRKDARFMQVNRMMNSLMRHNADARRRQLFVKTFTVVPLQNDGGIVEWLDGLTPYRRVLEPVLEERLGKPPLPDGEWFQNWGDSWTPDRRLNQMRNFFYKHFPLVMADWFRKQWADPCSWHAARLSYARSSAVMSIIGFILGLGDRHGENILMSVKDGFVVHVDFNMIFNRGEELPVKEVVPFRLTRNMINGFGPTGVEGVFRKTCEVTLRVMRDNATTLLTVIQTFVHDPLVEWFHKTEHRAQQLKYADKRTEQPRSARDQASDCVSLIEKRLNGHVATPIVYRQPFSGSPMSVEGQVTKLIELSSDEKLLADMYIGWAPFL